MSRQWMWRSGNDRRGPLCTAQLADLLRSRTGDDVAEVQVAGAAEWVAASALCDVFTDDGDPPADDAVEAVAQLLTTAEQLRTADQSDVAAELRNDRPSRPTNSLSHGVRARVAIAMLLVLISVVLVRVPSELPRSNAATFQALQRLRQAVADVRSSRVSATDAAASLELVAVDVHELAEELEDAAESLPLLSLASTNTDAGEVLARRELLHAARDLTRLAEAAVPSPVLEAEFRRHMDLAAAYLDRQSPQEQTD